MASLTGNKIKDTYQSLLKTDDNGHVTSVSKNITDGFGSGSGLYLKDTGVTLSGSVSLEGISQSPQANVLTYDTASGQIYYTASSAIGGGGTFSFTSSVLEYYVDKRFSGSCGVTIGAGRTITSTNPNYLTQWSASKVGDPTYPWPDPWSAAFAASASIATGQTTSARVIIKTGNQYTYGSSVLTQNGDTTGSFTNNLQPDIAVSQSDYSNRVFDLLSPNIEFHFEPETSLYNINKSWQQMLVSYISSDWTIAPEFKITGKGKFVMVYGQNAFIARWGDIEAPRAQIVIEADTILQNLWQGWDLMGQNIDINVNKWWSYSCNIFNLNSTDLFTSDAQANWPSQSLVYPSASIERPVVNVNINDMRWGQFSYGELAPPVRDFWVGIKMGHPYGCTYNININNLLINSLVTDGVFRMNVPSPITPIARNNTANINIGYVSASHGSNYPTFNPLSPVFRGGHITIPANSNIDGIPSLFHENVYFKIHVDRFEAFGIGLTANVIHNTANSTFIYSCDDYRNYGSNERFLTCLSARGRYPQSSSLAPNPVSSSYINNQIVFTGTFRNYSTGSSLIDQQFGISGVFGSGEDNLLTPTLILDNFNGYQLASGSSLLRLMVGGNNGLFNAGYSTGSTVIIKDSLLYVSGSNLIENTTGKAPRVLFSNATVNRDIPSTINAVGSITILEDLNKILY